MRREPTGSTADGLNERLILLVLIGVFTLVYLPPIVMTPKRPDGDGGIYRIWPEGRIKRAGESVKAADDVSIERLNAGGIAAIGQAFYFSVISAFHLGWRDLNVGSWITRMQPREYGLCAKGWVCIVSGVQSATASTPANPPASVTPRPQFQRRLNLIAPPVHV